MTALKFLKQNRLKVYGIVFSTVALFMAMRSWRAFEVMDYGNTLIYAAGALNFCLIPLVQFKASMFTQPLGETLNEAIRNPLPLRFRLATGLVWLMGLSGLAICFLYP